MGRRCASSPLLEQDYTSAFLRLTLLVSPRPAFRAESSSEARALPRVSSLSSSSGISSNVIRSSNSSEVARPGPGAAIATGASPRLNPPIPPYPARSSWRPGACTSSWSMHVLDRFFRRLATATEFFSSTRVTRFTRLAFLVSICVIDLPGYGMLACAPVARAVAPCTSAAPRMRGQSPCALCAVPLSLPSAVPSGAAPLMGGPKPGIPRWRQGQSPGDRAGTLASTPLRSSRSGSRCRRAACGRAAACIRRRTRGHRRG